MLITKKKVIYGAFISLICLFLMWVSGMFIAVFALPSLLFVEGVTNFRISTTMYFQTHFKKESDSIVIKPLDWSKPEYAEYIGLNHYIDSQKMMKQVDSILVSLDSEGKLMNNRTEGIYIFYVDVDVRDVRPRNVTPSLIQQHSLEVFKLSLRKDSSGSFCYSSLFGNSKYLNTWRERYSYSIDKNTVTINVDEFNMSFWLYVNDYIWGLPFKDQYSSINFRDKNGQNIEFRIVQRPRGYRIVW